MAYRLLQDPPEAAPTPKRASKSRRAAIRTISLLPTMFTLGNLLCGFGAVFFASRSIGQPLPLDWTPLMFAAAMIFLGMAFDGLDGRIARMTRSTSDLGQQLDSMADMVTFGVAPAFLAVQLIGVDTPFISEANDRMFDRLVVVVACIYVACTAMRLARFNVDLLQSEQQDNADHSGFEGLPSPGAAGTVASLALLHQHFLVDGSPMDLSIRVAAIGMVAIMLLSAMGMVSRLPYTHLLNRYLSGRVGFGTAIKVVVLVLLMLVHLQGALAAGFVLYALSAPALRLWRWVWPGGAAAAA